MKKKCAFTFACVAILSLVSIYTSSRTPITRGQVNSLDAQTELEEITSYDGIVIVDFYADWCRPCKNLAPVLEKVAAHNEGVLIIKVNIEKHRSASKANKVKSIPTLLFFKDGKLVRRSVGFVSEKEIQAIITELQA